MINPILICWGLQVDSLYILIPIALLFVAIAIKALFWAIDNNQYDDLDAAAYSILFDEDNDNIKIADSDVEPSAERGDQS